MSVRHIVRQIVRGCGRLPHVGEHPGTIAWLVIILLCGLANGGIVGFLTAATIVTPIYLFGAYERAQFSDTLNRLESPNLDAVRESESPK